MKVLSLFANIGVAEAYLRDLGIEVAVANELIEGEQNYILKYIQRQK